MNEWDMSEMNAEFDAELRAFFTPKNDMQDGWFTVAYLATTLGVSQQLARYYLKRDYNMGTVEERKVNGRFYYRIKKEGVSNGTETRNETET